MRPPIAISRLACLAAVLPTLITGCAADDEKAEPGKGPDAVHTRNAAPSEPDGSDHSKHSDHSGRSDESTELPDLVGKGLQYAQNAAQRAGFERLWSHDATGRDREQIDDRNWRVCFQEPAAGSVDPSTRIDFGVVELDESCPDSDRSKDQPTVDDGTLPDFTGTGTGRSARRRRIPGRRGPASR